MDLKTSNIRNFCIIAHIDHGKSTLADRMLELTKTINSGSENSQILDDMDLERERGITIKSHAIQMDYKFENTNYILNLIDTPGHENFVHNMIRGAYGVDLVILVISANEGIQKQTLEHFEIIKSLDVAKLIIVINKIDLSTNQQIEKLEKEIKTSF